METRDAAARWARVWSEGWSTHDVDAIAALYAADAHFVSHPFREPEPAREYVQRAFAAEASAEPHFCEPLVDGDSAAVEWRAHVRLLDGGEEHLRGVSLLRFDAAGQVVEHRDVWCLPPS